MLRRSAARIHSRKLLDQLLQHLSDWLHGNDAGSRLQKPGRKLPSASGKVQSHFADSQAKLLFEPGFDLRWVVGAPCDVCDCACTKARGGCLMDFAHLPE